MKVADHPAPEQREPLRGRNKLQTEQAGLAFLQPRSWLGSGKDEWWFGLQRRQSTPECNRFVDLALRKPRRSKRAVRRPSPVRRISPYSRRSPPRTPAGSSRSAAPQPADREVRWNSEKSSAAVQPIALGNKRISGAGPSSVLAPVASPTKKQLQGVSATSARFEGILVQHGLDMDEGDEEEERILAENLRKLAPTLVSNFHVKKVAAPELLRDPDLDDVNGSSGMDDESTPKWTARQLREYALLQQGTKQLLNSCRSNNEETRDILARTERGIKFVAETLLSRFGSDDPENELKGHAAAAIVTAAARVRKKRAHTQASTKAFASKLQLLKRGAALGKGGAKAGSCEHAAKTTEQARALEAQVAAAEAEVREQEAALHAAQTKATGVAEAVAHSGSEIAAAAANLTAMETEAKERAASLKRTKGEVQQQREQQAMLLVKIWTEVHARANELTTQVEVTAGTESDQWPLMVVLTKIAELSNTGWPDPIKNSCGGQEILQVRETELEEMTRLKRELVKLQEQRDDAEHAAARHRSTLRQLRRQGVKTPELEVATRH